MCTCVRVYFSCVHQGVPHVHMHLGAVRSAHAHVGPNEHEGVCSCERQEALLRLCAWDVPGECGGVSRQPHLQHGKSGTCWLDWETQGLCCCPGLWIIKHKLEAAFEVFPFHYSWNKQIHKKQRALRRSQPDTANSGSSWNLP